jgi:hypothetical protein
VIVTPLIFVSSLCSTNNDLIGVEHFIFSKTVTCLVQNYFTCLCKWLLSFVFVVFDIWFVRMEHHFRFECTEICLIISGFRVMIQFICFMV